ncbi:hypothetical protein AgCh_005364 [Apium graveolens]
MLTKLPEGHKVIGLKWIYKLKRDADGKIIKHKARLVAKGYVQEKGVDFDEIFALVTRLETVRLICKERRRGIGVSLTEALYGLRQAPRAWYAKLNRCLEKLCFKRCAYEHAVYVKKEGNRVLIIGVYVDDLLITGTDIKLIEEFKEQMNHNFEMSDMGLLSYYLGIEVKQGEGYIELRQTGYAKKMLEKDGMASCNLSKFLMDPKEKITKDEQGKLVDATQYRSLVGCLRYLVHTRPDVAYSVGIVSRYMELPTEMHVNAVKKILRYVKGTLDYGLVYSKNGGDNILSGYSDSNLAGDYDDEGVLEVLCFI